MAERALDGIRVIDISQGIAGPYATKLLADSGALLGLTLPESVTALPAWPTAARGRHARTASDWLVLGSADFTAECAQHPANPLTDADRLPTPAAFRYRCAKAMHVSPFMAMDLDYEFAITRPTASLIVHMATRQRNGTPSSRPGGSNHGVTAAPGFAPGSA